ncbi:putative disease resistance RPP13-like protein 1 [Vicia villosa]|uniref:putative disease resistance RPP13-like protein 1 n=1 Tax=Vicia villosa TaxID=3911 RepID=UPI00273B73E5|nr:putative disease resistance RPP13-like protein 1 [Vicia villosa]
MAEVIVGETLVSASVEALLQKLVSTDFRSTKEVDVSVLINLKKTLARVQPVLHHYAEDTKWLDLLIDVVYQVDTLFGQINTEASRRTVETPYQTLTPTTKVRNMLSKTHKLTERLERLILREEQDGLVFSNCSHVLHGTPTDSNLEDDIDSSIYGRDCDIKKVKDLLLSSSDGDSKIRVISIVGMGGIGKTNLAKHLYNDPQVKDEFELKVWAYISKDFDAVRVFETILQSITSQSISNRNMSSQILESHNAKGKYTIYPNLLLVSLQQILNTSKFLLVLDDVWDTKSVNWISLMDTFNAGEMGSKIIITTRDERVARSMQTILFVHYLRPLENEDCWTLFARYAFGTCNDQQRSHLEEIGREISKKCDGLPLAAVEFGAILYGKLSPNDWNCVLESNIWEPTNPEVHAALESSYHYLSPPIKRCFAYCSIFPKKSILEKKMVVQLWIAEDLVGSFTSQERWKVGEQYFDVLVSKSLIQRRSTENKEENFEMHNLVHDLATMVSSPYCIRLGEHYLHERVQNLSYNRGLYDSFDKFEKLYGLKYLRTFLALPLQKQSPRCLISNQVVHDLLPTMKQLRVLSLSNYKSITEVPKSIGDLLYLQYLNLSHTNIEWLPSETCNLYNLQFLLLGGCKRLTKLPEDMGKLVNLHHLDVSDTALKKMPVQIAKLENLHTLSDFVVSKHNDGLKVAELGNFPHLHGKLSISQLQNVTDPSEVDQSNTKMKEQIKELALEWDCGSTFPDSQIKSVVLEHLQPSTNLKSLTIKGCGGISFPNWLGDFSFRNMVYLKISNCDDCLWLPPLGQLENLKELFIEGMPSVQTIGTEFYGSDSSSFQPFPSLEILHFADMQEWDEWNLIGGRSIKFTSLKTLSLSKCPKLIVGNVVDKFPSLTEFELRECPLVVQSTPLSNHVSRQLMFPLNSLQQLTIDGIPSSMSFPADGLRKTLKFLIISNCENLEFLPLEYLSNYTLLEELKISYSCNSMTSFTLGALPALKRLFIEGCKNLKSILIAEDASLKSLSFLRSIKIWDCIELESFPPSGLATPNLVYFAVWKCEKLPSLPEAMHTLTNLQEMEVDSLPNLQSFVIDDLPSSLQELTVGSVGGLMWNTKPTWEHLTCLSVLRIKGDDMVNSLMRPFLPSSLVTLYICGFSNTSFEGKWLQHLTSLQNLEIFNAPKLKTLPKKGLPSSLSVLSMTCCPSLQASLRRKRGREWRKIAHIPAIIINDELIT